jgi:cell division protein ZapC
MRIEPNNDWYWEYSRQRRKFLLHINGNNMLLTQYGLKDLGLDPDSDIDTVSINVDDSSMFYVFIQCILDLPYTRMEKIQIAINAITVLKFCKAETINYIDNARRFNLLASRTPSQGEVLSVVPSFSNNDIGDVLVLKVCNGRSICMVLGTGLKDGDKSYNFLDVVTVDNECLYPVYKMNVDLNSELQLKSIAL